MIIRGAGYGLELRGDRCSVQYHFIRLVCHHVAIVIGCSACSCTIFSQTLVCSEGHLVYLLLNRVDPHHCGVSVRFLIAALVLLRGDEKVRRAGARCRQQAAAVLRVSALWTDRELPIALCILCKIECMYEFAVDAHFGTIIERHDTDDVGETVLRRCQDEGVSPVLSRHGLREDMVSLTHLIGYIGMRCTLEHCYFLAVTRFDVCSGQVTRCVVFLSGPYIPDLSFLQYRRMERILSDPILGVGAYRLIQQHDVSSDVFKRGFGFSGQFGIYGRTIVNDGIILGCYHSKMGTLCGADASVVRRGVGLDIVLVQERCRRQHVGSVERSVFVVGSKKRYVLVRSNMQSASIYLLRINGIADFARPRHSGARRACNDIAVVESNQRHLVCHYINGLRVRGERVADCHLAVLAS